MKVILLLKYSSKIYDFNYTLTSVLFQLSISLKYKALHLICLKISGVACKFTESDGAIILFAMCCRLLGKVTVPLNDLKTSKTQELTMPLRDGHDKVSEVLNFST